MPDLAHSDLPVGYVAEDYSEPVTVCRRTEHDFAEGDEGAIYCTSCTGYRCGSCAGGGSYTDINSEKKRCYGCGGFGVMMGWHEWPYRLNPWNWAKATTDAAEAAK